MGAGSRRAQKNRLDKLAAQQRKFAAQSIEAGKHAEARTTAAEQSRMGVGGLLGTPGTYDLPGTSSGGGGLLPGATATGRGIFADPTGPSTEAIEALKWGEKGHSTDLPASVLGERTDILDPEAFTKETSKTAGFRMRSRLTSEAEQMLAREGDAWNRLNQGTLGLISEEAATSRREEMRSLKNAMAKGGTARKNAFNQAAEMVSRERNTTMKIQQTWKANLDLDKQIRANAQAVQEGNDQYLNNLPGIRSAYTDTMNNLAQVMATTVIPNASITSSGASIEGAKVAGTSPNAFLEGLLTAGIGIVGGAMTAGIGGGLMKGVGTLAKAGAASIPGAGKVVSGVGGLWNRVENSAEAFTSDWNK